MEERRFDESTTIDAAWDLLVNLEIATEEEVKLVTQINGLSLDALESILYARLAWRKFPQMLWAEFSKEELLGMGDMVAPFLEEALRFYKD